MRPQLILMALLMPVLAACQNVYHPLKNGVGYMDVPVGTGGYQISYIGDSSLSVSEARHFAMLRAAEVAVLNDKPFFQIKDEHIYISAGTRYWPPTDYAYADTFRDHAGRTRAVIRHSYDPGYVEQYTIPDVEMQVALSSDPGAPSIPAAYLLAQAQSEKIKLSPGVAEKLEALPPMSNRPVNLPPEPKPTTKPGIISGQ